MDYIFNLYIKLAELNILASHAHNLEHSIRTSGYQQNMSAEYTTMVGAMNAAMTDIDGLTKPANKTKNDIVMMLALKIENEEILPVCQTISENLLKIKAAVEAHSHA
ncbi:MAG: hypothetical protein OXF85_00395 [Candidatus Saccharibacteria bacterium]|nr:hypothetical protein [Candidatus Saccharibacteria bacterium]